MMWPLSGLLVRFEKWLQVEKLYFEVHIPIATILQPNIRPETSIIEVLRHHMSYVNY